MEKLFFKLLLIISCLGAIFTGPAIEASRFQAIWVKGEGNSPESELLNYPKHYLIIKTKFFEDEASLLDFELASADSDYKILIKRSDTEDYPITIPNGSPQNYRYKYYIPDIDLIHKNSSPFVIYNIEVNSCVNDSNDCHIQYHIKYFSCDSIAQEFYQSLNTDFTLGAMTDKIIRKTESDFLDHEKIEFMSKFTNDYNLPHLLMGKEILKCQVKVDDACCSPYPCLIDMTSIQCVCALEGSIDNDSLTGVCEEYINEINSP